MERPELAEFRERVCTLHRQDDLEAGMVAILDAFAPFGVQPFVLKGPVLARLLYTADEHRGYIDIDLLVAPHDMPRARQALSGMGCLNALELRGIRDVAGSLHSDTWLLRKEFSDGPGAMMIDLHWRLPGCEAPPEVAWKALAARQTTLEIHGRDVAVLDRGGLALHLATHAASHGPDALKPMGDLARGIDRWPPEVWRSAARLAHEVQATPMLAAGLRLIPAGAALAESLELPSGDEVAWEVRHRDERPRGTFHIDALAQARTAGERLAVLRHALLPPAAWIKWEDSRSMRGTTHLVRGYVRHLRRAPRLAASAWRLHRRTRRARSDRGG
ncbi:MAG: nucleotidyltransferase family protein [Solirubrobacteraceae bacterium]